MVRALVCNIRNFLSPFDLVGFQVEAKRPNVVVLQLPSDSASHDRIGELIIENLLPDLLDSIGSNQVAMAGSREESVGVALAQRACPRDGKRNNREHSQNHNDCGHLDPSHAPVHTLHCGTGQPESLVGLGAGFLERGWRPAEPLLIRLQRLEGLPHLLNLPGQSDCSRGEVNLDGDDEELPLRVSPFAGAHG